MPTITYSQPETDALAHYAAQTAYGTPPSGAPDSALWRALEEVRPLASILAKHKTGIEASLDATTARSANLVYAGPSSGSAAAPTFRSLAAADIPTLAISKVSGLQLALDAKVETSALNELVDDRLNSLLVQGTGITLTYDDTAGTLTIAATGGGGGGTPGGADTQVQFNDGGAFGGDAGLAFNKMTNVLTISGGISVQGDSGAGSEHFGGGITGHGGTNNTLVGNTVDGPINGNGTGVGADMVVGELGCNLGAQTKTGQEGIAVGHGTWVLGIGGAHVGYYGRGPYGNNDGFGDNVHAILNAVRTIGMGGGMSLGHSDTMVYGFGSDTAHTTSVTTASGQCLMGIYASAQPSAPGVTEFIVGRGVSNPTPLAVKWRITDASGMNVSGTNLTVRPSLGTGSASGGSYIVQIGIPGSSGTTANTALNALTIAPSGQAAAATLAGCLALAKDNSAGCLMIGDPATAPHGYLSRDRASGSNHGVMLSYNAHINSDASAFEYDDQATYASGVLRYQNQNGWVFYTAGSGAGIAARMQIQNSGEVAIGGVAGASEQLRVFGASDDSSTYALTLRNLSQGLLWSFRSDGLVRPGADNTYDIGDATHLVRAGYFGALYLNDGTVKQVTLGAADSAGSGFKQLRVAN